MSNRITLPKHRKYFIFIALDTLFIVVFFFLQACTQNNSQNNNYAPVFANDSTNNKVIFLGIPGVFFVEAAELTASYLTKHLNDSITVRSIASIDFEDYLKKLDNKYYNITMFNGLEALKAEQNGYTIVGKMSNDENYKGCIITKKGSGIQNISDLKGKKLVCPGPRALAGTIMPLDFLKQNGINLQKDITCQQVASFESCYMNVYLGKAAAGTTWKTAWENFAKSRPDIASELEVKWETPAYLNNAILVRNDMNKDLLDKLTHLLFTMHTTKEGQEILQKYKIQMFEKANSATYAPYKKFMHNSSDTNDL